MTSNLSQQGKLANDLKKQLQEIEDMLNGPNEEFDQEVYLKRKHALEIRLFSNNQKLRKSA